MIGLDANILVYERIREEQARGRSVHKAVAEGFRHLGFKDDHDLNAAEWIVYDALYAYCQRHVQIRSSELSSPDCARSVKRCAMR